MSDLQVILTRTGRDADERLLVSTLPVDATQADVVDLLDEALHWLRPGGGVA